MKVVNSRAAIRAMKKGTIGIVTLAIEVFPMPQPIKRQEPTGGVQSPMQRFTNVAHSHFAYDRQEDRRENQDGGSHVHKRPDQQEQDIDDQQNYDRVV